MTLTIVDAMNVIGSRPQTRWWRERDQAMCNLIEDLADWGEAQCAAGHDVLIVFDGYPISGLEDARLPYIFAERPGPDGADDEIVEIVEDDEDVLEHIRAQVERLGYRVSVAPNGRRALELDKGIEDADLILTDIVMPGGMNGARFAAEALKRKPGVKVVFMSGYPDTVLPTDLLSLQSAEMLMKPFTIKQLSAALHTALDPS